MSGSQRKAIITLIEKQHKDRTLIEKWRPISLINVNAKIIPKVIASRLKKVLPNIIHHNQTGYVEDRYIGETIRSIFVIIHRIHKWRTRGKKLVPSHESEALEGKQKLQMKTFSELAECLAAVDKTRNMEHPGTFRNIPEHPGT